METINLEEIIDSAKQSFQNGDYKLAIDGFKSAHKVFVENGDELNAAEMANNLSVALLQDGQKKEALAYVEGTDVIFENHNDTVRQAMALGNLGAALEALKRFDEAEISYQNSADLLKDTNQSELRSHVLKSLSALQIRKGKQLDSIFSMQKSLSEKENLTLKDRILQFFLKLPNKFLWK